MESAQPATSQQAAEEAASSSSNPSLAATRESPTAAQSSFKILPRPSPPPPPPATPSTSQLQDSPNATARAPRASSEGRGITATTRSAAATEATYRRTGSESALTSRNHSSAMELAPDDEQVITPRSSSPELSSSAAGNSEGGSVGPRSTQATEATDETVPPPQLDSVLLLALAQPRDRILLLRAEAEIERFLATPTQTRLPLSPPFFPPSLNSYQRLLIHRLADTFGITREVEPAQMPAWAVAAGQPQTGVVVLVKGEGARLPPNKLATYVPAPEPTSLPLPPSAAPSTSSTPLPTLSSVSAPSSSIPSPTSSPSPSTQQPTTPSAPTQPQIFKILPRSSHRPASSSSSSVGTDDDGIGGRSGSSTGARGRRELTLEEREAAYKEARERIFAQQPEERKVQDLVPEASGSGITRPSSAGSSYSRSSAALSVSGARAAPSEASTSTSTSSMSIHSGFQGPTVYYPPSTSMGPGGLSLRPSAPSFDPSGAGGWAPYGDGRGYAGEGVAYGYSEAQCGGDEWSRRAAGVGGPSPYPYSSQHAQQPPIQVTAPPPRPPPQPHQPSFPGSSTQQYPPLTRSGGSFPPASHPSSSSTHSAWATPRAPSLPSPALSTSSGGSSYHQLSHSHAHHPHPSSTTTDRSSSSGSVPSVTPGGYLMRFPDGGVVGFNPSPASSVSGHSTGTGAGAYAASSTSSYSAAGSTRSTSSASTSRTASSSNLRGPTSAVAAAGGSESAATRRRTSHSTSHSLSSGSAGGGSGSAAASEAGSGSGGRKGAGSEKRNGSERGGAARASDKGKECEKDVGSTTAAEGSGIIKAKSNLPLHPSLPAKPAWVTSQPPKERSTSFGSTSALAMAPSSSQDSTPSVGLADGFALAAARPASVASSLSSSSFGLPGTTQLHQHYSAAGYPSPTTYSPAPPPPHPQQQPHHLPPPGAYYGAGPPVPQPWPSRGINVNSEGYYLPPPPPPPPLPSGAPTYPDLLQQAQWTAAAPSPHDPIMQGPELRRPPPRSTALFDPNKPTAGGAGAGAGRRAGSVGRGERGVADVERGVEGLRL